MSPFWAHNATVKALPLKSVEEDHEGLGVPFGTGPKCPASHRSHGLQCFYMWHRSTSADLISSPGSWSFPDSVSQCFQIISYLIGKGKVSCFSYVFPLEDISKMSAQNSKVCGFKTWTKETFHCCQTVLLIWNIKTQHWQSAVEFPHSNRLTENSCLWSLNKDFQDKAIWHLLSNINLIALYLYQQQSHMCLFLFVFLSLCALPLSSSFPMRVSVWRTQGPSTEGTDRWMEGRQKVPVTSGCGQVGPHLSPY